MRQLVRQTSGRAIAVLALSALLIWGSQSSSSSHASSPAASTRDAGGPHDEYHALEWIYGGGEGGDTGRGQHYHCDRREGVG